MVSTFQMTSRKPTMTTSRKRPSARSRTLDIIERILSASSTALSVTDIIQLAGNELPTQSKTPHNSVARDLALDIKKHGDGSRFVRTMPGRFGLRARAASRSTQATA